MSLSEGRGTPLPFEMMGAPWLDGEKLSDRLRDMGLPGVLWRPVRFRPSANKWTGQSCGGVQVHVACAGEMRPVEMGVRLLFAVKEMYPKELTLQRPTEPSEIAEYHLDLLAAGPGLREALWSGSSPEKLLIEWHDDALRFGAERKKYLIY